MNNENQNVEFKESWRDEYVKWLCGFANAQGGKLYIGINDKGEVCGFMATIKREKFIAINTGQHVETLGENKLRELVEGLNEGISEGLSEGLNEGINEDVQRKLALVIGTIHDYPGIKTPAIVQRTDIPLKTLERYISQLRTWGIIEFRGAKKTGGYFAKL